MAKLHYSKSEMFSQATVLLRVLLDKNHIRKQATDKSSRSSPLLTSIRQYRIATVRNILITHRSRNDKPRGAQSKPKGSGKRWKHQQKPSKGQGGRCAIVIRPYRMRLRTKLISFGMAILSRVKICPCPPVPNDGNAAEILEPLKQPMAVGKVETNKDIPCRK